VVEIHLLAPGKKAIAIQGPPFGSKCCFLMNSSEIVIFHTSEQPSKWPHSAPLEFRQAAQLLYWQNITVLERARIG
jgi:hypothetical protein